ncbi:MAG: aminotransferase class I/II-fold pyridoxal phosphate-dependent enzyme [Rhodospirillales bacterium]|nr:aminotransferase class I/II-fold pyridoxal phosphate-dependent enzyme [Rhodospirillales bacterium]MCB9964581.1 aminotransferase class I/II-fold pyridoxal phosphate-dependent enzyme [Rhodospirillales bacterium]
MLMNTNETTGQPVSRTLFRKDLEYLTPNPGAEMLRYGWKKPDILSLGQGEGCRPTPDFIVEAAYEAKRAGKTFYAPVLGFPEVRQELSAYYRTIYGLDISPDRLFLTGSGTTAMNLALTSLLDAGDEIIAVTPIWKNLLSAVEVARASVQQVSLDLKEGQWSLDLDKLFGAVTPRTRALLIVTPSNPTGWMITPEEIQEILAFARHRGLWVISDEVYGRIVYDRTHAPSFLEYAQPEDRLYVINSFSKTYAMTGWRLGWLVGPACAEPIIRDIALYHNMGPASFIQLAGAAALRQGEDFLQEQVALWRRNRDRLTVFFREHPQLDSPDIPATFYAFFRHREKPDCVAFGRELIDKVSLSLAPGIAFGKSSGGFTRLCFACSESKLEKALERLQQVI